MRIANCGNEPSVNGKCLIDLRLKLHISVIPPFNHEFPEPIKYLCYFILFFTKQEQLFTELIKIIIIKNKNYKST